MDFSLQGTIFKKQVKSMSIMEMGLKILSVVGVGPQFIKAAVVSRAISG